MKVYIDNGEEKILVGRADIPAVQGPVYRAQLSGAAWSIIDEYVIGTVTHLPKGGGAPLGERAVLLSPGQAPEILPGWQQVHS